MGKTPKGQTRRRVHDFVRRRLLDGNPPTVREVQQAFGFRAVETARGHLEALVAEGAFEKTAGRSRGLRLPARNGLEAPARRVPLLGQVQAGALTTALEDPDGYLTFFSLHAEEELFALTVRGPSMTEAGILDGDVVLVRRQPTADSGAVVVALVGDEATVKRLYRRGRRIELRPAHPDFDVLRPRAAELSILGKVIEVRRYLENSPVTRSLLQ